MFKKKYDSQILNNAQELCVTFLFSTHLFPAQAHKKYITK